MNIVVLVGRLESFSVKETRTGRVYVTGNVSTEQRGYRDEDDAHESTWREWHRFVIWGRTAERWVGDNPGRWSLVQVSGRKESPTFEGDQGPVTLHQVNVQSYEIMDATQPTSRGTLDHIQRWTKGH